MLNESVGKDGVSQWPIMRILLEFYFPKHFLCLLIRRNGFHRFSLFPAKIHFFALMTVTLYAFKLNCDRLNILRNYQRHNKVFEYVDREKSINRTGEKGLFGPSDKSKLPSFSYELKTMFNYGFIEWWIMHDGKKTTIRSVRACSCQIFYVYLSCKAKYRMMKWLMRYRKQF